MISYLNIFLMMFLKHFDTDNMYVNQDKIKQELVISELLLSELFVFIIM